LGIAALLPPSHAARLGALFGFAVLSKPLLFGPMWLWVRPLPSKFWRELRLGPAVLGLPWLYTILALWHTRHVRRARSTDKGQARVDTALKTTVGHPQRSNALIVVAKQPAPGQTKTRLTPPLSEEHAAALYECFLRDTLDLMRQIPDVQPVLAYLPHDAKAYFAELAPDFELILQEGHNLGTRLDNALSCYLRQGYERVAIMNSDGPNLPPSFLEGAFAALEGAADVVLGPCDDGGYYLIGLKRPAPRLLREVQMSTPNVTSDTLRVAAEEGLRVELLPVWYDVDDGASLVRLASELDDTPTNTARHTRAFLDGHRTLLLGGASFQNSD
jgi:rSAM/selenodomain-associated transferase 1